MQFYPPLKPQVFMKYKMCALLILQMTPRAKLMWRRPSKWKPAHCKDLKSTSFKKHFYTLKVVYFGLSLTRHALFPQSFSGFYWGRRKLSNSFHPSIPSDNHCKWRRAQHNCCRAVARLHDHSMVLTLSLSLYSSYSHCIDSCFDFSFLTFVLL